MQKIHNISGIIFFKTKKGRSYHTYINVSLFTFIINDLNKYLDRMINEHSISVHDLCARRVEVVLF